MANLFLSTLSSQAQEKKPPFDEVFKKLDAEVRAVLKKDKNKGIIELERVGNLLSKDYPEEFMPYAMLDAVARMTDDQEKSLKNSQSTGCPRWLRSQDRPYCLKSKRRVKEKGSTWQATRYEF